MVSSLFLSVKKEEIRRLGKVAWSQRAKKAKGKKIPPYRNLRGGMKKVK
jgi:hypothetical protein